MSPTPKNLATALQIIEAQKEEIQKLRGLRDLDLVEARRLGREEFVEILMQQDPETFPEHVTVSRQVADTGDYSTCWDRDAVRRLFDCEPGEGSIIEHLDAHFHRLMFDNMVLRDTNNVLVEEIDRLEARAVREYDVEKVNASLPNRAETTRRIIDGTATPVEQVLRAFDFLAHDSTKKKSRAEFRNKVARLIAYIRNTQPRVAVHVRQFDLVRQMRSHLHDAELITDAEYAWLCGGAPLANAPGGGSPSPRRLEDYDEINNKLIHCQVELANLKDELERQKSDSVTAPQTPSESDNLKRGSFIPMGNAVPPPPPKK